MNLLFNRLQQGLSKDERRDIYLQMIDEIIASKVPLRIWENDFIRSLGDWMGNGHYLTTKQMNTLEALYAKVMD